jgi:hypothetical protein
VARFGKSGPHEWWYSKLILWGVQVDKEGANPEKARQEMSEAGLLPEEWGGDVPMVEVSPRELYSFALPCHSCLSCSSIFGN